MCERGSMWSQLLMTTSYSVRPSDQLPRTICSQSKAATCGPLHIGQNVVQCGPKSSCQSQPPSGSRDSWTAAGPQRRTQQPCREHPPGYISQRVRTSARRPLKLAYSCMFCCFVQISKVGTGSATCGVPTTINMFLTRLWKKLQTYTFTTVETSNCVSKVFCNSFAIVCQTIRWNRGFHPHYRICAAHQDLHTVLLFLRPVHRLKRGSDRWLLQKCAFHCWSTQRF